MCGTLDYLSPEIIKRENYGSAVDNWCIGILTYEFLVGSPPFVSQTKEQTYNRILNLDLHFPSGVPDIAQDFIRRLLKINPEERMALKDVKNHPWIRANVKMDNVTTI